VDIIKLQVLATTFQFCGVGSLLVRTCTCLFLSPFVVLEAVYSFIITEQAAPSAGKKEKSQMHIVCSYNDYTCMHNLKFINLLISSVNLSMLLKLNILGGRAFQSCNENLADICWWMK